MGNDEQGQVKKPSSSFLHFLNPHLKITLVRLDADLFLNLELVYPALPFALCTIRICVSARLLQSYLTLCDPQTVSHQVPLSMGFSTQESWRDMPSSRDLPYPGIEPTSLVSCTGSQVLYHQRHLGSPCERIPVES